MYPKNYNSNNFISPSGLRFEPVFEGMVGEDDVIELVQVGVRDLKEFHNRDVESCDVNNIVQRFANGDITALQQTQGSYVDLTGLPKDLRGMSDMIDALREGYENLNEDIKKEYSSFNSWLENVGSPEWFKIMSNKNNSENINEKNIKEEGDV